MFHNVLLAPLADQTFNFGEAAVDVQLAQFFDNEDISGTVVKMETNLGTVNIEMFDDQTPGTVANFLEYVTNGAYNNTVFHRAIDQFVVQGGGYKFPGTTATFGPFYLESEDRTLPADTLPTFEDVPSIRSVTNEFATSPRNEQGKVNTRGTLAMAKLGGNPNSATNEFFFNLKDNSANLDNQNGGFTTFARVLGNGMDVVDKMVNDYSSYFSILDDTDPAYPFANLPLRDYQSTQGAPTEAQTVVIRTAGIGAENIYTVTSSNRAVVDPTVNSDVLSLTPLSGGTTTITVTATSFDGAVLTDSFDVTVAPTIQIGTGGFKSMRFVEDDGTRVTATVKNATGLVGIAGTGVTVTDDRGVAVVTGTGLVLASINLTDAGAASSLTVSSTGGTDGGSTLGTVGSTGTLAKLTATKSNLTGDVFITGGLGSVSLRTISGGSINSTGADVPLSLKVGSVTDGGLNVASSIKSLSTGAWTDTGGAADAIVGADIVKLSVKGNFAPDVTVGRIGTASVSGDLTGGTWNVTGDATRVSAAGTAAGWTGVFTGAVGTFSIKNTLDGALAAGSIKTLSAGILAAPVTLSATTGFALTNLLVGEMNGAEVRAASDVKTVSVRRGMTSSAILVGLAADANSATVLTDFTNAIAQIVSVKIAGPRGAAAFSNSAIVAPVLGTVSLGAISDAAATVPFAGVAADTIKSLSLSLDGKKASIKIPTDQANADAQLAEDGVTLTNVDVLVL